MPAKRTRIREPLPVERAFANVEAGLPDAQLGRKPFYTVYCICQDGLWVLVFNDKIRDRVNDALVHARKNLLIVHTTGDKVEFRAGIPVKDELLQVFRILKIGDRKPIPQAIHPKKPPMLSVVAYYRGPGEPPYDFQMIQIELPVPGSQGTNRFSQREYETEKEVKASLNFEADVPSTQRSFVLWDTQMMMDLGYDPNTDNDIRCYFSEAYYDTREPLMVNHLPVVKEYCMKLSKQGTDA